VRRRDRSFHRRLRGVEIGKGADVSNPVLLQVQVRGIVCMPFVRFQQVAQKPFAILERAKVL
jgi:hypothetical protein